MPSASPRTAAFLSYLSAEGQDGRLEQLCRLLPAHVTACWRGSVSFSLASASGEWRCERPTLVQRARVPAEAPQAEERAQLLEHRSEADRCALILDQLVKPSEAGVLDEGHGQRAAVVGLHTHTHTHSQPFGGGPPCRRRRATWLLFRAWNSSCPSALSSSSLFRLFSRRKHTSHR